METSRREFLALGVGLPAAVKLSTSGALNEGARLSDEPEGVAPVKLTYRTLGRTGLKVTMVGFGCMITSDASVIERAADLGVNYFDTARGYQHGNNERMVGAALKAKRKDIYLSSKSGAGNKQHALKDLDTSLRELGTDYLDIWYLHGKDEPQEVTDDLIEAQQVAKQQGKIRFAGVSTHSARRLIPFLVGRGSMDVVLVTYNFSMGKEEDAVIEQAAKAGMGVVGMKVMAGGFRRTKREDPLYPKLKHEGTMLAALKWVLTNPNVATTIPSMTDGRAADDIRREATGAAIGLHPPALLQDVWAVRRDVRQGPPRRGGAALSILRGRLRRVSARPGGIPAASPGGV